MKLHKFKNLPIIKAYSKTLPVHKGYRRVWIESLKLLQTTLASSGTYHYSIDHKTKVLTIQSGGEDNRKLTIRKSGVPVLEICNKDITELYGEIEKVTIKILDKAIIIEPLKEAMMQQKARDKFKDDKITFVDIFSGGGLLTESMKNAKMKCLAGVDYDDRYLTNFETNNLSAFTYNTNVAEMDTDLLPEAMCYQAGIPCENYSLSGISKSKSLGREVKGGGLTGAMGYYYLNAVKEKRPAISTIEETVGFKNSDMRNIIVGVLGMMGYKVSESIMAANDFGGMTKRKRYVMVATMSKTPFIFPKGGITNKKRVLDILEVPIEKRVWLDKNNSKTIAYSLKKEQGHIAKGDGFRLARTSIDDTLVATITKDYYKIRITDPWLVHPTKEDTYSLFTPRELARLNGLPDTYIFPTKNNNDINKTVSANIVGQGVCVTTFTILGEAIVAHIRAEQNGEVLVENIEENKEVLAEKKEVKKGQLGLFDFI